MSHSLTPSKRQHSRNHEESNGKKFQKSTRQSKNTPPGGAVFRVLCPSSRIESVLGKGNIIEEICQEAGAKIKIDDSIQGCDERVISIMGPDNGDENNNQLNKNDNEDSQPNKEQGQSEENNNNDAEKDVKGKLSVQKALLLVFERFFEGEKEREETNEESNGNNAISLRLLVLSGQVGCLLGRGGSIIKQMSFDSGAQIRVLPRDKLPQCASSGDEVVQITGLADGVKKALKSISDQILETSPHDPSPSNPSGSSSRSHNNHVSRHESYPHRSFPFQGASFGGEFRDGADFHSSIPPIFPKFHEHFMPGRMEVPEILSFRLLCPDERVGGVIGKGGAIIKTLQHETRCEIKVLEGSDGEERLIVISGPAHPDDRISAVQDAVLRVQSRITKAIPDSKEKGVTSKLIVPSNQIGCLLGKGGSIIAEMRKATGAFIRVLGKDQIPKTASENDEVVQITGELDVVKEALLEITTRLQHHLFRDAFPSINHPPNHPFSDRGAPPFPPFMGRGEISPPGMFPKLGPFRNFDSVGAPMPGGFHPNDDRPPFLNDRPGFPRHPQNMIEGGPMGLLDHNGPPHRRMPGFGGESQQAVITNTTVEVVVPSSAIPSIYGEDGGCLRQIRQISDAKIVIPDPKPGVPETVIIISGTPEQTHAAQSLIQAFVMLENESR